MGGGGGIAADADRNLLDQSEHLRVGIDLDYFRALRPVIHAVLRQRAERAEPGAECEHDVRLRDQLHARLRALIAERPAPERMARGEAVIVQIAGHDGGAELLGQCHRRRGAVRHDDPAAGDDHREFRAGQQGCGVVEALRPAGAALDADRLRDFVVGGAVEIVARDVELGRPHLQHRPIEAASGDLGHAPRIVHVTLVFRDVGKDRQLLGFLKTAESHRHGAGFGRDHHHRTVRPVGGGDGSDEIGDAGSVLRHADAVPSAGPGVAVRHMARTLLVHDRDEADAGGGEQVERVHERRSHDPEHVGDAVRHQRLDEGFTWGHLRHRGPSRISPTG